MTGDISPEWGVCNIPCWVDAADVVKAEVARLCSVDVIFKARPPYSKIPGIYSVKVTGSYLTECLVDKSKNSRKSIKNK